MTTNIKKQFEDNSMTISKLTNKQDALLVDYVNMLMGTLDYILLDDIGGYPTFEDDYTGEIEDVYAVKIGKDDYGKDILLFYTHCEDDFENEGFWFNPHAYGKFSADNLFNCLKKWEKAHSC